MLRKILIVEDSNVIQLMYELHLARYRGLTRITAANGSDALEALQRNPELDLIVLDINMPVMNGLEFLLRLRREPAYARLPVVVVTTQGAEIDEQRCLGMGANAYVTKPFTAQDLYAAIEQATGAKPQ
jgi:two-component system, chemotaxis family, chemotaxis protein CheY